MTTRDEQTHVQLVSTSRPTLGWSRSSRRRATISACTIPALRMARIISADSAALPPAPPRRLVLALPESSWLTSSTRAFTWGAGMPGASRNGTAAAASGDRGAEGAPRTGASAPSSATSSCTMRRRPSTDLHR